MTVNPMTADYLTLKQAVLSNDFAWYVNRSSCDDFDFYGHSFVNRPEVGDVPIPTMNSELAPLALRVLSQVCEANGITVHCVYRMAANSITPTAGSPRFSEPHVDHEFPHTNLLIHLTDVGGATVVEGQRLEAGEDGVVVFTGEHFAEFPTSGRRVVLVATFLRA